MPAVEVSQATFLNCFVYTMRVLGSSTRLARVRNNGNHYTRFTLAYGIVPTTSESCEVPTFLVWLRRALREEVFEPFRCALPGRLCKTCSSTRNFTSVWTAALMYVRLLWTRDVGVWKYESTHLATRCNFIPLRGRFACLSLRRDDGKFILRQGRSFLLGRQPSVH